jgi:hypothetical protein
MSAEVLVASIALTDRYENDVVFGPTDSEYESPQAAINAVIAAGGGTVRLREGGYVTNLTLGNGVILCGMGSTDGANDGTGTIITGTITIPNGTTFCSINDLTVRNQDAACIIHNGDGKLILNNVNTHRIYASVSTVGQIVLTGNNIDARIIDWSSTVNNVVVGNTNHLNISGMLANCVLYIDGAKIDTGNLWETACTTNAKVILKNILAITTNFLANGNCAFTISNCKFATFGGNTVQNDVNAVYDISECVFTTATFACVTAFTYPTIIRNCTFGTTTVSSGAWRLVNCLFKGAITISNGSTVSLDNCVVDLAVTINAASSLNFHKSTFNGVVTITNGYHLFNNCIFKEAVSTTTGTVSTIFTKCNFVSGTHTPLVSITTDGSNMFRGCVMNNQTVSGVGISVTAGNGSLIVFDTFIECNSHAISVNSSSQFVDIQHNNIRSYGGGDAIRLTVVNTGAGTHVINENVLAASLGAPCIRISQAAAFIINVTGNSFSSSAAGNVINACTSLKTGYNKAIGITTTYYSGTAPTTTLTTYG